MSLKNSYKKGGMFEGATHLIFANAKALRKNMTHAETILWMHFKSSIPGVKFRRQHPIGIYIADFYCHKAKLIIEIDGAVHNLADVKENDEKRQKQLAEWGYEIIRFTNDQVIGDPEGTVASIIKKITVIINLQNQNASLKNGV